VADQVERGCHDDILPQLPRAGQRGATAPLRVLAHRSGHATAPTLADMRHQTLHLPAGVRARRLAIANWDGEGGAGPQGAQEGSQAPAQPAVPLRARARRRLRIGLPAGLPAPDPPPTENK
jgi:hypothetical protein